jgi:hypothetical protein
MEGYSIRIKNIKEELKNGLEKRIRDSFSELKRGVSYPKGYDVDASLTSGIAMGKILALKSDGATKGTFGNETQPTWILADGCSRRKNAIFSSI